MPASVDRSLPLPGRRVRGSSTGRPVMALLDLLGRRWTLRLLWELRPPDPLGFRALRGAMDGVSPTLLNQRLKELRAARLVELGPGGFRLSAAGRELLGLLLPLGHWADAWARILAPRRGRRRSGPGSMSGADS
jgi:DNA-binding HxlR family transcriptional regulator